MNAHVHNPTFCFPCEIAKIARLLPRQAPIKDFIHQNILQVYIDTPFDQALLQASELFNAKAYMDLSYYRDAFRDHRISERCLDYSIDSNFGHLSVDEKAVIKHALFNYFEIFDRTSFDYLEIAGSLSKSRYREAKAMVDTMAIPSSPTSTRLGKIIHHRLGLRMDISVNAKLFRLIGAYIDQGVGLWPYLERFDDFLTAVRYLASHSIIPLTSFVDNTAFLRSISCPPDIALANLFALMFAQPELYQDYLKESLLSVRGWAGMVHIIANNPACLAKTRKVDLESFVLIKTALEWQFIEHHVKAFTPITNDDVAAMQKETATTSASRNLSLTYFLATLPHHLPLPTTTLANAVTTHSLQRTWAEALTQTFYQHVADTLAKPATTKPPHKPKFQALFCVDDRESAYAYHLEQETTDVMTYGFPGYFNIDCYYRPYKSKSLEKLCPANLSPQHVLIEERPGKKKSTLKNPLLELTSYITRHGANSIFFGFVFAYTLGHLSLFRLLLSFLQPLKLLKAKKLAVKEETTSLIFQQKDKPLYYHGLSVGYSADEMAARLFNTLRCIGLNADFSRAVFVIGHGSSSVNNPHFAAYDCGACAGRPGNISARVFAAMANKPEVRALVKDMGISIPDETIFVGGYHDTTTDRIRFFDIDNLSAEEAALVDEFAAHMQNAAADNAYERCLSFSLIAPTITKEDSLREVEHRARALFEPRPELGHTNASLCVIGRKQLIYRKDFSRRAFFQSYDPTIDTDGHILSSILMAAIPVCGGINLDYYFSRLDPAVYGCGTKLSHNVCGLVGVGNGLDDDLRTGLPIQMTELHDPIPLLVVVEQAPEIIMNAVYQHEELIPWVENAWVQLGSVEACGQQLRIYDPNTRSFVKV